MDKGKGKQTFQLPYYKIRRRMCWLPYTMARGVLGVAVAYGMAGIIVGMITETGLGLELGTRLAKLAGGNTILTLALTMLASLILGMGVPTTANYLITSTIMAGITPPVALAVMGGAAIAKSNPMRTGLNAVKLVIVAFLVLYVCL